MKKILLTFILLLLLSPTQTFAHAAGYPPFFTINGKMPTTSPAQNLGVILQTIVLTQDIDTQNYTPQQSLYFLIDAKILETILPPDFVKALKYTWDFGDGEKGSGITNTHTYIRAGSYMLSITASSDPTTAPSLIESVQINIVPQENYVLPTAGMKVQETIVKDPLQDFIKVNLAYPVSFDASLSRLGTTKIVKYQWDFGDGEKSDLPKVTHTYKSGESLATPFLRITDVNGLVSDSFVTLTNDPKILPPKKPLPLLLIVGIIVGFVTINILGYIILKKKNLK